MAEITKGKLVELGYTVYQVEELLAGIQAGISIACYAKKEMFAIQMREIRLGLMAGLPMEAYANTDFDWFQLAEIRKGLERGVDVACYASSNIPYQKMRQVRKGLEQGVDVMPYLHLEAGILRELRLALASRVNILPYIKEGYDAEQLKEIRMAKQEKLPIDTYLEKEYLGASIHEIYLGLKSGVDVSIYANAQYRWNQMREIRLGMENQIKVLGYASPYFYWKQMREIRLGLEHGIDVKPYCNLMYTYREMRKRRESLEENKPLKIAHVQTDSNYGAFKLHMSEDAMQVQIEICEKENLKKDKIIEALELAGVRKGISEEKINQAMDKDSKKRFMVIAEGELPKDGKDGWYEYFYNLEEGHKPHVLEDGSVDYQQEDWIQVVEEGEKIAIYHEAQLGKDGYNVMGRILPSKRGRELRILMGKDIRLMPDRRTYLATQTGRIEKIGNQIRISQVLMVDEVTNSTGNVTYAGVVYVKGNVGSGTKVKADGDVIVDGYVQAATIESGGNICVRMGVNASGNGKLKAEKNIQAKFLEAVELRAGGNIMANYCLNCEMRAEGQVVITGSRGVLAGGTTWAEEGIEVGDIGNHTGIPTVIRLGNYQRELKEQQKIENAIVEVQREIVLLQNVIKEMKKRMTIEQRSTSQPYLKVEDSIYVKENELKDLQEQQAKAEKWNKKILNVSVVARGRVYEGADIMIRGAKWKGKGTANVVMRNVDGRIALLAGRY